MDLDVLLVLGAAAIAAIFGWTVWSARERRREEEKAREDLAATLAKGAQPASLYPRIDVGQCIGCGACVKACPEVDVLAVLNAKAKVVNPSSCIGHGECARACPTDAIRLVIGTETRGVDIPLLQADYQTNVPGLYVVGELGGMGLIYNAMSQGLACVRGIAAAPPPRREGAHQVAIVGAGPAGLAAALACLEAKLDFVVLDQESVGGTVLQYPRHKIVMTRPVELPLYGKLKVSSIKKEDLLAIWQDILQKTGLSVRTGIRVDAVTRAGDGFELATSAGKLAADRVILALGRRGTPRKLGVPGEELPKVTYRLLEPESYAGSRCVVVGGGDAAVEAALALAEAGAETALLHRGEVFDRIKKANQERLDRKPRGLTVHLKAQLEGIEEERVIMKVAGARAELPNDYVLIFAGGVLPTAFLEKAGVEVKTMRGEEHAPSA